MGRGRGKAKKFTLTNTDDTGSGEEERIPVQKKRGRPQKQSVDGTISIDEDVEKIEDEDNTKVDHVVSSKDVKVTEDGKKRKRNKQLKEEGGDLVKEVSAVDTRLDTNESTQANGFRHTKSRRKSKPRRAAEAGVKCL